jgi:hypothetical protein
LPVTSILLQIGRRRQLFLAFLALHPHPVKLLLNLLSPLFPILHLRQSLTKLSQLFLDTRLLTLGADALELPFVSVLAEAEREGVVVVALEGGAGGDCY